jgi:hypothetical protein
MRGVCKGAIHKNGFAYYRIKNDSCLFYADGPVPNNGEERNGASLYTGLCGIDYDC